MQVSLAAAAAIVPTTPAQRRDTELVRKLSRAHVLARGQMLTGDDLAHMCENAVRYTLRLYRVNVSDGEREAIAQRLAVDVLARFGRKGEDGRTVVPLAAVGPKWSRARALSLVRQSREWRDTADSWKARGGGGASVTTVSPLAGEGEVDGAASPLDLLAVAALRDRGENVVPMHERDIAAAAAAAIRADLLGREVLLTDTDERRMMVAVLAAVSEDAAAAIADLARETGRTLRAVADGDGDRGRRLIRTHYGAGAVARVVRAAVHAAALDASPREAFRALVEGNGRDKLAPRVDALPDPTAPGRRSSDGAMSAPAIGGTVAQVRALEARELAAARLAQRDARNLAAVSAWLEALPTASERERREARRRADNAAVLERLYRTRWGQAVRTAPLAP